MCLKGFKKKNFHNCRIMGSIQNNFHNNGEYSFTGKGRYHRKYKNCELNGYSYDNLFSRESIEHLNENFGLNNMLANDKDFQVGSSRLTIKCKTEDEDAKTTDLRQEINYCLNDCKKCIVRYKNAILECKNNHCKILKDQTQDETNSSTEKLENDICEFKTFKNIDLEKIENSEYFSLLEIHSDDTKDQDKIEVIEQNIGLNKDNDCVYTIENAFLHLQENNDTNNIDGTDYVLRRFDYSKRRNKDEISRTENKNDTVVHSKIKGESFSNECDLDKLKKTLTLVRRENSGSLDDNEELLEENELTRPPFSIEDKKNSQINSIRTETTLIPDIKTTNKNFDDETNSEVSKTTPDLSFENTVKDFEAITLDPMISSSTFFPTDNNSVQISSSNNTITIEKPLSEKNYSFIIFSSVFITTLLIIIGVCKALQIVRDRRKKNEEEDTGEPLIVTQ